MVNLEQWLRSANPPGRRRLVGLCIFVHHCAGCAIIALLLGACGARHDPLPGFPRLVLWAWERPERLAFVDPRVAAVAYLARTISWHQGTVESHPRLQPLEVPPGVRLMAVVR